MKTQRKQSNAQKRKSPKQTTDPISRNQGRRVLKTVTGAVIGGIIAGPVGVAAGAIAGAIVRRGPVRKNANTGAKMTPNVKIKTRKANRAAQRPFTNIYPNIP